MNSEDLILSSKNLFNYCGKVSAEMMDDEIGDLGFLIEKSIIEIDRLNFVKATCLEK